MKKQYGVALWALGIALIVEAIVLSYRLEHDVLDVAKTSFLMTFWAGMLLYNWLWGSNRGHIAHFLMITLFTVFGAVFLAVRYGVIDERTFFWLIGAVVVTVIIVVVRYLPEIYRNYFNSRR